MIFDQIRELFIFDFDDTLARNTGKVRVVKQNGTMLSLESSHFANYVEEKGDYFDFSDFMKVAKDARVNEEVMQRLIFSASIPTAMTVIITAREVAEPVREFIKKEVGLDIPVFAVRGLGKKRKTSVLEEILNTMPNVQKVVVFEDMVENIVEMCSLCEKRSIESEGYFVFSGVPCRIPAQKISLIDYEENRTSGAGFIIMNNKGLVLGLDTFDGDIDIPKGKVDEGETALEAARRELFEEAGISSISFPYGELPIVINNISVYVSLTNEQPNITPNPHSGIIEHAEATWNSFSQMKTHSIEFLKPFILVAESIVASKN